MDDVKVVARSLVWMLGGSLAADRLQLESIDGATVTLRSVSADDQERWRAKRKPRMLGYGALGDVGDVRQRSYPYVPLPEWVLDCCTVCVEVSRAATLPPGPVGDELYEAGFDATDATQLDFASTAVADLLRLVLAPTQLQVPTIELMVLAQQDIYTLEHHVWLTPGFLWRQARERWEVSQPQAAMVADLWSRFISGPNRDVLRWPLRRFGVAMQRSFAEDRLVDFAIALEGIFMSEDDPHRNTSALVARRANRLLDGDRTARKIRTRRVLDAYGVRSDIVHGRLPPEEQVERSASDLGAVVDEALRFLLAATARVELSTL